MPIIDVNEISAKAKRHSTKSPNKRIASNPLQYANGLIVRSNQDPNCFVNLIDQDKNLWLGATRTEPLVPYLGWLHEQGTISDPIDGLPKDGYGWQLTLSGLKTGNEPLGYADWNDADGVRHLIYLLEDKEALLAFTALRFPDAMAEATKALAQFQRLKYTSSQLG